MSVRLRAEDCRALDLLLDRSPAASAGKGRAIFAAADGVSQQQIHKMQSVLNLLEAMPAIDPPQDLVARTLTRIQQRGNPPLAAADRIPEFQNPLGSASQQGQRAD